MLEMMRWAAVQHSTHVSKQRQQQQQQHHSNSSSLSGSIKKSRSKKERSNSVAVSLTRRAVQGSLVLMAEAESRTAELNICDQLKRTVIGSDMTHQQVATCALDAHLLGAL